MRNIWNNRLPRIIAFPRIIAPFWCENINNRPWLLFEEIRYPNITVLIVRRGLGHNIQGIAKSQELRKTLWQCRNIDFASVSRFMSTSVRIGKQYLYSITGYFYMFLVLFALLSQLGFFLSDTKPKCIAEIPSLTTQHVYLEKRPYWSFCWTRRSLDEHV